MKLTQVEIWNRAFKSALRNLSCLILHASSLKHCIFEFRVLLINQPQLFFDYRQFFLNPLLLSLILDPSLIYLCHLSFQNAHLGLQSRLPYPGISPLSLHFLLHVHDLTVHLILDLVNFILKLRELIFLSKDLLFLLLNLINEVRVGFPRLGKFFLHSVIIGSDDLNLLSLLLNGFTERENSLIEIVGQVRGFTKLNSNVLHIGFQVSMLFLLNVFDFMTDLLNSSLKVVIPKIGSLIIILNG